MTTYLDMLPDELYQMIYSEIKLICVQQAAAIGARHNRFTHIPNRRTNDSVIYHWLRDKPEKANSLWTDGESIYSYQYEIYAQAPAGSHCVGHAALLDISDRTSQYSLLTRCQRIALLAC
eukprot:COSAG03_NODE_7458_length_915_cov_33.078431_2_plen_120_part_00